MGNKNTTRTPLRAGGFCPSAHGYGGCATAGQPGALKRSATRGRRWTSKSGKASMQPNAKKPSARGVFTKREAAEAGPWPMLTLRAAVILMAALLTATASGLLTFLATASLPEAFLAAGPPSAAAIALLNAIIAQ
jgi:hypothetical protein